MSGADREQLQPAAVRNRWIVLANVSVGTFMATLDGSIANVALPTMSVELNAPIHWVQWVLTAYLLTICATLPIMGKISDLIGRGTVYNYGFLLFAIGSGLCGISNTLGMLIISRIIQALGASCLMTNSQAIVAEVFAKGDRGRAIGIVGTVVSLGSLTGPGLGGILVERLGWPSIFWINIPIGLLGFIAGWFLLPKEKSRAHKEPFDYRGSALFIFGIVGFLYTVSNGKDWGWTSVVTIGGLAVSIAVLAYFYIWENKTNHPMLDFGLYRVRTFAIGNITAFLSFIAMFFTNVMMPFYMQNVLMYSAEKTGYTMMVFPFVMAIVAPFSGWLSDKIGPNILTTLGLMINALGFALLHTLSIHEEAWVVGLHLSLFGLGGGLFQSPNNSSVMGAVPGNKLGTAGGLNALVRNVGMVLGISFSVSIYSTRLHQTAGAAGAADAQAMLDALHLVFWVAMGVCLLALAVSVRRLGKKSGPQKAAA
ncbi:MFS transporter [Paenibacillus piri]|uniref:DHA2 family efflux MFS transporter permease subunit n=1 Tax=Paenibacillus piri TaxID=2547395 RepID=A0A4R5KTU6_9BACL|nr:MFS transporter [Paenibacillus piri]TDF98892.1 DHA2 family efflux MFS transporter permease subunit [Paenibacillus piri]